MIHFPAYEVLSDPTVCSQIQAFEGVLNIWQKKQIYDRHGEVIAILSIKSLEYFFLLQEGLKAHEGGHHQANPFDIFSNFFGGGR
jgi:DnaJ-related protein SCJ1